MSKRFALFLAAAACLGACGADPAADGPVVDETHLGALPEQVLSPLGDRTVIYGGEADPRLTLSAGFMRRTDLGAIEPSSALSWAPDSRSFYVNDSGGAAWSRLRLWRVDGPRGPREDDAVRQAAIAELTRRNGCTAPDPMEYATWGFGWADGGARLYVLADVRRVVDCPADVRVQYLVSLIDIDTAEVIRTEVGADARRVWPDLPWAAPEATP